MMGAAMRDILIGGYYRQRGADGLYRVLDLVGGGVAQVLYRPVGAEEAAPGTEAGDDAGADSHRPHLAAWLREGAAPLRPEPRRGAAAGSLFPRLQQRSALPCQAEGGEEGPHP